MEKRIRYIDIAKGIGILCVIIGHTLAESVNFIYSFHMPLFFILSGYFFKFKEPKDCMMHNVKRLVLPYIVAIGLFVLYFFIKSFFGGGNDWIRWIQGGLYGSGWDYSEPIYIPGVGGIWFFLALFVATIIFNSLRALPDYLQLVCICAFGYWGGVSYSIFPLPWEIQR